VLFELGEEDSRVCDCEGDGGDADHSSLVLVNMLLGGRFDSDNSRSVQNQELDLVTHQRIAPATDHLRNTVYGTNEYSDKGDHCSANVELESRSGASHRVIEVILCLTRSVAAEEEIGGDETTQGHGSDLSAETSNHD
jgi:hypothetical protein